MPDHESLEERIRDWQRRELIDDETSRALLADIRASEARATVADSDEPRFSVGITILLSLGTVAMSAAVAVWFAREWGEWSRPIRLALAVSVPALLGIVGVIYKDRFPALARVFLTLAAIATLSATALLAAMYDLHPRHAIMTFTQAGVFLAMALVVESALLAWTGVLALSVAFGFEVTQSWGGFEIFERPIPYVGFGLLVIGAGFLLRRWQPRIAGHIVIVGALHAYISMFTIALDFSSISRTSGSTVQMWLTLLAPFGIAMGVILYGWIARKADFERAIFIPLFSLLLLFALASLWPERWYQHSWVDVTLFTIATLAGAYLGVVARSPGLINVSVVFFAIDVLTRFVDWFWDVMPGFLFFGTMGVLLILGGISLEGVRRKLIRSAVEA